MNYNKVKKVMFKEINFYKIYLKFEKLLIIILFFNSLFRVMKK